MAPPSAERGTAAPGFLHPGKGSLPFPLSLHAEHLPVLLVLVLLSVAWFGLLNSRNLIEPDEGRYAEIPREMLVSGDWVTPRLDGFKYFEKPPLQYWLTAAGYRVLGVSNGSARLWPALLGFAGAVGAGLLGARLYGREAGFAAAFVLASSVLYFLMGHALTLDMTVSVFLFTGIACLVMAQLERGRPAGAHWMWLGWAALAGATLSKGLIGVVLPGGAVVLYSLWQRDWALWRHLELGKGLLVLLALVAPWFVVVSLRNPEFAWFFFVREHVLRFATQSAHRTAPVWFFIPVVLLGSLPWTGSWLRAVVQPGFAWRRGDGTFSPERLLWVFAVLVFVFFSASSSKLAPYVLPVFASLAVLAGRHLAQRGDRFMLPLAAVTAALLMGLDWAADHVPLELFPVSALETFGDYLHLAAVLYIAAGLSMLVARRRPVLRHAVATLLVLAALQTVLWSARAGEPGSSSRDLANAILAQPGRQAPVYLVSDYYPQSLPFYLHRTITLVVVKDEMAMGIQEQPQEWIDSLHEFARRWQARGDGFAVMGKPYYKQFHNNGLPMRVVYEGPRLVVVSRQ